MFKSEIFNILFHYEDEDIGWFSNPLNEMIKNDLKRNRLLLFFISREEGQLKGRTLKKNNFAVFKVSVVLLVINFIRIS